MMRLLIINVNVAASTMEGCQAIAVRLEAIAPGLIIEHAHWSDGEAAPNAVLTGPDAIILGPNETPFPAYPETFQGFLGWVRGHRGPLLGICGGHQVLALAHGAEVGPVHDVPPATSSYQGMPRISGDTDVHVVDPEHPIMRGLPDTISVSARHVDQVRSVPDDFRLLATGTPCAVQAITHQRRPQLGLQFHPERPTTTDHGDVLLRNWIESLRST